MVKKNYDFLSQKNLIIFLIVILLIIAIYTYSTQFTKKITIKNLTYFRSSKNSYNLISDENNNVYKISNSIWYMFFTSAELYSSLNDNQRYTIKGYGLRIPFLGFYPMIIKATPINS